MLPQGSALKKRTGQYRAGPCHPGRHSFEPNWLAAALGHLRLDRRTGRLQSCVTRPVPNNVLNHVAYYEVLKAGGFTTRTNFDPIRRHADRLIDPCPCRWYGCCCKA